VTLQITRRDLLSAIGAGAVAATPACKEPGDDAPPRASEEAPAIEPVLSPRFAGTATVVTKGDFGEYKIPWLAVRGEQLFFTAHRGVYVVPTAGGEPKKLRDTQQPAIVIPRKDDLVLIERDKLTLVSSDGKELAPGATLPARFEPSGPGGVPLALLEDGQTLVGQYRKDDSGPLFLFAHDLSTGKRSDLLETPPPHPFGGPNLTFAGDAAFYACRSDKDAPGRLIKAPLKGGSVSEIPCAGSWWFEVIGATDEHLLLCGRPNENTINAPEGFFRIPLAGGAPQLVMPVPGTFPVMPRAIRRQNDHIVMNMGNIAVISNTGGVKQRILDFRGVAGYQFGGFAADEAALYISSFVGSAETAPGVYDNTATIHRIATPA
jgi:hypothetical protein